MIIWHTIDKCETNEKQKKKKKKKKTAGLACQMADSVHSGATTAWRLGVRAAH